MPTSDALKWREYRDFTAGLFQRGDERETPLNGLLECVDYMPQPGGGLRAAFLWERLVDTTDAALTFNLPTTGKAVAGFNTFRLETTQGLRRYLVLYPEATAMPGFVNVLGSTSTSSTSQSNFSTLARLTSVAGQQYQPIRFVRFFDFNGSTSGSTVSTVATIGGQRQYPLSSGPPGGVASTALLVPAVRDYFHIAETGSTDQGVYRLSSDARGIDVRLDANPSYDLAVHQQRLLRLGRTGGEGSFLYRTKLDFTDPLSDNNLAATSNVQYISLEQLGDITHIESFMPGDLAMLKREWGWYSAQGALSSPFVRQATNTHPSQFITYAYRTPEGLAYLTVNEGVWAYTGGNFPVPLSPQFVGTPMTEVTLQNLPGTAVTPLGSSFLGSVCYGGLWLFTPKGYVRDSRTGAWFISSALNTSPVWPFFAFDQVAGRMYAARSTSNGATQILHTSIDENTMLRSLRGSVTLPLWDLPNVYNMQGTRTVLREIDLHLQTFAPNSQIQVQILWRDAGGQDRTSVQPLVNLPSVGSYVARVLPGDGGSINTDWLKIRLQTQAPAVEAPFIDRVRVGYTEGTPYA